jgi:hypothetical protein
MSIEFLNQFKLSSAMIRGGDRREIAYLISIPVLYSLIFTNRPEVMTILLECNLHDRIIMGVNRSMTISEIHSPDFDVLVT